MVYFGGFFAKPGRFAGFSLHIINLAIKEQRSCDERGGGQYISLEPSRRVHPYTVIFRQFFSIYSIIRRKDQRSCDGRGGGWGDIILNSLGRKLALCIEYQSFCVVV